MATRNISLPQELEAYLEAKVASGEYAHASEVVREGLRLMMEQEAQRLDWLRNAIAEGQDSIKRAGTIPSQRILEEVRKETAALRNARQKPKV
ncbi:MAG: type II toxin-antitoxin system ParD family antitoxin [Candidatus Eremiobacteraeota bacterium]|nr:type II toxin-antitoxin system ParD family antitoxin [Candidatus Eremiobacteraeota bacterium]